jgi:Tfp pilus assembly protein PilF
LKKVSFAFRNNLITFCKKIKHFVSISAFKDEKATEREQLMLAAYLNQAMCCLKLNDFCATRDHCHKALEMDPKNEKGLFRMGQVTYKLTSNLI